MSSTDRVDHIRNQVIAELFGSGGVSYDRAAKEVLYFLPGDFIATYTRAFHEAFRDLDGGVNGRGTSAIEKGKVGRLGNPDVPRGGTQSDPRDREGKPLGQGHVRNTQKATRGTKQASAKNMFGYNGAIGEETAQLLTRVNKRLRSISREMKTDLDELKNRRLDEDRKAIDSRLEAGEISKGEASRRMSSLIRAQRELDIEVKAANGDELRASCKSCGSFTGRDWKFCAKCGIGLVEG